MFLYGGATKYMQGLLHLCTLLYSVSQNSASFCTKTGQFVLPQKQVSDIQHNAPTFLLISLCCVTAQSELGALHWMSET